MTLQKIDVEYSKAINGAENDKETREELEETKCAALTELDDLKKDPKKFVMTALEDENENDNDDASKPSTKKED